MRLWQRRRIVFVRLSVVVLVLSICLALNGQAAGSSHGAAVSPPTLYLPYAWKATWWANGPHSDNGKSGTRNNVDLGPGGSAGKALAAASGTAHVGTCSGGHYVRVDHGGGWTTQYWHLASVASGLDGKQVSAGDYLGTTGIVCGNPTSFSHIHFGLFYKGSPYPLDGVSIGGYTIHAGSGQYNGWWTRNKDGKVVHKTTDTNAACCLTNDQLRIGSGDGKDSIGSYFPWDHTWHLCNGFNCTHSDIVGSNGSSLNGVESIPVV